MVVCLLSDLLIEPDIGHYRRIREKCQYQIAGAIDTLRAASGFGVAPIDKIAFNLDHRTLLFLLKYYGIADNTI